MKHASSAARFAERAAPSFPDTRIRLALAVLVISGFTGLGYEIVWTQQATLWLGHESAAVLAVVAAFFGGLACGALILSPRIDRSARPARWYAACEVTIGLWALALVVLMSPVTSGLLALIGAQPSALRHWSIAFAGTFLLLLPATAAMGATLPAMERIVATLARPGRHIAALYAGNTLGAILGVVAAAFWLVPALGLTRTAGVCALLNLACALVALRVFTAPTSRAAAPEGSRASQLLLQLAVTGVLGIGYEVLVVRVLSQVTENTVYTFSMLLAMYLAGTALGAAAYSRWLSGKWQPRRLHDGLLRALAATCLLGIVTLASAGALKAAVLGGGTPTLERALLAEAALAALAFLPPTLLMGALFSHLATTAAAAGISFGRALGVNTLGAAAAPFLFGVLLLAGVGAKWTLLLIAVGYLALASLRSWTRPLQWVVAGAVLALGIRAPTLALVDIPEGGRLLSYREGVLSTVSIVEDAEGVASLHINNRQQEGSSATLLADARQALLPTLLDTSPRQALFIGLGTGVTASVAAQDPALQIDAVELLPEVIASSAFFTRLLGGDQPPARLHLKVADARRYVRTGGTRYDLIVADNFHPARSGSGSLYTVEHFSALRARLTPEGIFCQWLPLHQLDLDTMRSIVRSFLMIYPHSWALLAQNSLETPVVGLIARADGQNFELVQLRERLSTAASSRDLDRFGIDSELALLGSFIAGPDALARFSASAPANTDDHPVVTYRAPRITYAPQTLPRDRLITLLHEVDIQPGELLSRASLEGEWPSRLSAYWAARNRFIEAGRDIVPSADVQRMLSQVREPLLSVLRISPDFRPAYDPLLRMAGALARIDPDAARTLLAQLQAVEPARPEIAAALRDLTTPPH